MSKKVKYLFPLLLGTYSLVRQDGGGGISPFSKRLTQNSAPSLETTLGKGVNVSFARCVQAGQKFVLCYCYKPQYIYYLNHNIALLLQILFTIILFTVAAENPSIGSLLYLYCSVLEAFSHPKPQPFRLGADHRNSQWSVNYLVVDWNSSFLLDFNNWMVRRDLVLQIGGGLNSCANDSI